MMKQNGFTMVELIVSIGILLALLAITTINISGLPSRAAQNSSIDVLISDLRSQQTKAMSGNKSGGAAEISYGVHFDDSGTSYTIFNGSNYSQGATDNFVVTLDPNLSLTNVTFPGRQIVFSPISGDVVGYTEGSDSVSITNNSTGEVKTLRINKYGATY